VARISRRQMLVGTAACASVATGVNGRWALADRGPRPTITLISGWQAVNIGDIAHTPGVLNLIDHYLPEARVLLWPGGRLDHGAEELLKANHPRVTIATDSEQIYRETDLLLHGSGPSVVRADRLAQWHKATGKPYGIYGVTVSEPQAVAEVLRNAKFVFTRETASIKRIREAGVEGPEIGFGPDGTFALKMRNNEAARRFLSEHGLESGKFICVVPRLRYTPYHKIRRITDPAALEQWKKKDEHNKRFAEVDHAKAREAIVRWVRATGGKALIVPEMTYQLEIMQPLLIDPLPDDVRRRVVRRTEYWLPDEAASTYAQAAAVLSFECHSPIIAAAVGTPAFYLRQPEDTIKGQMYYDLGLNDWVFEIDQTDGATIAQRLMKVEEDRMAARTYLAAAMKRAEQRFDACWKTIAACLSAATR